MSIIVQGGINEMYIEQEKFKSFLFAMVMFALGFALCYCMLGRADVQNNGTGANDIREQISSSQSQQHIITGQIGEAKQQVDDIRSIVADTGNAIADIEQILRGVRQRGKS